MKVILIRHGLTPGNIKKVYLGLTDESLSKEGLPLLCERKKKLENLQFQHVDKVYTSPMKRCIETANMLYPTQETITISQLTECNFGDFEYKNYAQLKDTIGYQRWLDSNGCCPFPNGESREEFSKRVLIGFETVIDDALKQRCQQIAVIIHGGSIMSIMECHAKQKQDFYCWQVGVTEGYLVELTDESWKRKTFINETKL